MADSLPTPPSFSVGDELRVVLTVKHRANLEEVRVIFERRHAEVRSTITLIGDVDETEVIGADVNGRKRKESTATLVTIVDEDHLPGAYFFGRLVARTAEGSTTAHAPSRAEEAGQSIAFNIAAEDLALWDVQVELEPSPDEDGEGP